MLAMVVIKNLLGRKPRVAFEDTRFLKFNRIENPFWQGFFLETPQPLIKSFSLPESDAEAFELDRLAFESDGRQVIERFATENPEIAGIKIIR
jgi:hypothetical protein